MNKLKLENFIRRSALVVIGMTLFAFSCVEERESRPLAQNYAKISFEVDCEGGFIQTKNSFTADENGINNLNLIVYDGRGRLYHSFYGLASDMELNLVVGQSFSFYALANYGSALSPPADEQDIKSLVLNYSISNLSDSGIPMSGMMEDLEISGDMTLTITVQRILSKVGVIIDENELTTASYEYKGVKLRQCPSHIRPWTPGFFETQLCFEGDSATAMDLSLITEQEVFFYLPENCRGQLLESSDPWQKIPDNLECSEFLPYVEIAASYDNLGLTDDNARFRFYLGANSTNDFDVRRNHVYHVTLIPSDKGILNGSWKLEAEDLLSTRSLNFTRDVLSMRHSDQERIRVNVEPRGFSYNLIYDEDYWTENGITLLKTNNILTIVSDYTGAEPVSLSLIARDVDGFASDTCSITVAANREPVLMANYDHLDVWGGNEYPLSFSYTDADGVLSAVSPALSSLTFSSSVPSSLLAYSNGRLIAEDWWGKSGGWVNSNPTYTATFTYLGKTVSVTGTLNGHTGFGETKAVDHYYREFTRNDLPSLSKAELVGSTSTNVLDGIVSISPVNLSSNSNWKYNFLKVGSYSLSCSFRDPSNGKLRTTMVPMYILSNVLALEGDVSFRELTGGYNPGRVMSSHFEVNEDSDWYDTDIALSCDVEQSINFQVFAEKLKYIDHNGLVRTVDAYDDWLGADLYLGFSNFWIDWVIGLEYVIFSINGFTFRLGYQVN